MRRALILSAVLGTILTGLGCKQHIAGRNDCTYSPSNAVLKTPYNPYPTVGTTTGTPAIDPMAYPDAGVPDVMPAVSSNIRN